MSTSPLNRLPAPPPTRTGGCAPTVLTQTLARDAFGREIPDQQSQSPFGTYQDGRRTDQTRPAAKKKEAATDALGRRAGALADELDFPAFVTSLVHGTFDAIVDSSIKQMEAYADLVAAVAKPLDQFAQENVTKNQARDWLVEQYPADVGLVDDGGEMLLAPTARDDEDFGQTPSWLADFGYENESMSRELLEENILPVARQRVAQQRLSSLATMVLLGMQRVVVKDGTIAARLKFRAAAADHAAIQYATNNDPDSGATEWGRRGRSSTAVTKVSTVDVNVQSDSELKAQMYGDVKINFASETVPLDRFVDEAQRTLLERNSRRLETSRILNDAQNIQSQPAPQPVSPPATDGQATGEDPGGTP